MEQERVNFIKTTGAVFAMSVLFLAACIGIFVFFPGDVSDTEIAVTSVENAEKQDFVASSNDAEVSIAEEKIEDQGFVNGFFAETDVSGEMDFGSSASDDVLVLYRNPATRIAVEWFFAKKAKERSVAIAILDAASRFDISPALAFSLAHAESEFKPDASHTNVNGSVDRGLFQLNSYSFPNLSEDDFYDPEISAYYGMSHLYYCIESAGNEIAGLAMYNAGRNKVQSDKTPQKTLNYISKIERYKQSLEAEFASEILAYYSDGAGNGNSHYLAKF